MNDTTARWPDLIRSLRRHGFDVEQVGSDDTGTLRAWRDRGHASVTLVVDRTGRFRATRTRLIEPPEVTTRTAGDLTIRGTVERTETTTLTGTVTSAAEVASLIPTLVSNLAAGTTSRFPPGATGPPAGATDDSS